MSTTALVLGCLFIAGMSAFVAYLLNRKDDTILLGADDYDAFMDALDNPPAPSRQLTWLLGHKAPWE